MLFSGHGFLTVISQTASAGTIPLCAGSLRSYLIAISRVSITILSKNAKCVCPKYDIAEYFKDNIRVHCDLKLTDVKTYRPDNVVYSFISDLKGSSLTINRSWRRMLTVSFNSRVKAERSNERMED